MSADLVDGDELCRWTKVDEAEAAQSGIDADEWCVYGTPEQGAAEYGEVIVLSKRSGRVTRVRLGEEVSYCVYRVAETLEVLYEGNDPDSEGGGGGGGSRGFHWHRNEDSHMGGGTSGSWLVRGESGRAGTAVVVVNGLTKKQTAVFLIKEAGSVRGDSLYEFVRC